MLANDCDVMIIQVRDDEVFSSVLTRTNVAGTCMLEEKEISIIINITVVKEKRKVSDDKQ